MGKLESEEESYPIVSRSFYSGNFHTETDVHKYPMFYCHEFHDGFPYIPHGILVAHIV